jgi:phosphatidylserine synthase
MQSVKRAILYPIAGWTIWMTIVMTTYEILPEGVRDSAFFVGFVYTLTALAAVLFSVLYLRKAGSSSLREGWYVGLVAMAVVVALDMVHNVLLSFDLAEAFARSAPGYVLIPLTTALIMGCLNPKKRKS